MNVDDLLRTENFAAETGDAVLAKFDNWALELEAQSRDPLRMMRRLHVNDIGRADGVANAASRAKFKLDIFDHLGAVSHDFTAKAIA
jgi:hypothetical protein